MYTMYSAPNIESRMIDSVISESLNNKDIAA